MAAHTNLKKIMQINFNTQKSKCNSFQRLSILKRLLRL